MPKENENPSPSRERTPSKPAERLEPIEVSRNRTGRLNTAAPVGSDRTGSTASAAAGNNRNGRLNTGAAGSGRTAGTETPVASNGGAHAKPGTAASTGRLQTENRSANATGRMRADDGRANATGHLRSEGGSPNGTGRLRAESASSNTTSHLRAETGTSNATGHLRADGTSTNATGRLRSGGTDRSTVLPAGSPSATARQKTVSQGAPAQATPQAASSAPPKKSRIRRREQRSGFVGGLMYFLFIGCLAVCIAVLTWMAVNDLMSLNKGSFSATITLPATEFTSEEVPVTDENGNVTGTKEITHANLDYVSDELYKAGLIQYKWLFQLFCSFSNADRKLSPGEYELKSSYDYRALIQNMRAGAGGVSTVTVTIPEGFTMLDIFQRFEENKVASASDLLTAAQTASFDYDFLSGTEDDGALRLEGYLYPDTYEFYVGMEASSAIGKLLDNFSYKFTDDMVTQAQNMGYSVSDIIKIASIIEKEAKLEDDRAYVASVIYNRLNSGMSLGMDSTILYLHQDHEGEPTAEMLSEDSLYNTHIYGGLPPTAICSPGLASIMAALNPAESDYFYFYSDGDSGKLQFFSNYNDFANYVNAVNG